ncbi:MULTISPECIES: LysR family transcriptional regulator [Vibrio]|uniref:LysR family transcriptional regulator n=2 Tax=Vibrio TaxID=662 RepID=A0A7X4RUI9_9VIBR|nr:MULTISPECIES: LysR family transcriptional regulator [Vibrio]MBF9003379.1 LysR family transcriptional regulator [Vibrio nitrifigilis]MZI93144.1 LysR family transcriptional regulator [Vibrio eleionomae]
MDKIDAMRTFNAVVAEGSFVKAAQKLDISPQLVSKYVAQLEAQLKTRLLNRTTRRVHPTEAGLSYYERSCQVLHEIEDMENALSNLQTQVSGTLRVSAPMSFGIQHMAEPLNQFQQQYPDIQIELMLTDRKVDLLEEGVDVALRIGRLQDSTLVAKKIAPIRLVVCAAPHYFAEHGKPQNINELSQLNYLRFTYSDVKSLLTPWPEHLSTQDFVSDFSSNNGDVIVKCAILGQGYAIQPTFLMGDAIKQGQLEVLDDFTITPLGLYALYNHREYLASKVRHFIDFLAQYFGHIPPWDSY